MNDIQNQIKKNILEKFIDESYKNNNIIISFSIIDDKYFLLHIYNPNDEELIVNERNRFFFETLCNMLFNKNEKEKGCFNHQQSNKSNLYESNLQDILNYFLKIQYSFVLVEISNMKPLSISCLINNYIYNVCTNYENRGQGNMEKLLNHFFELVKNNKLKNGLHREILLDVVFENPDYKNVKKYYEDNFNFELFEHNKYKTILKKKIF